MMLAASVFIINCVQKHFHRSVYWTPLDEQSTDIFALFLYTLTAVTSNSIHYKNITKKFEYVMGRIKTLCGPQIKQPSNKQNDAKRYSMNK